ncbi:MAG: phosphatidate cytidylyltransferase [Chromatiales bacterium]|jgi:phosphatidate cytidylyltransferase
MLKQRVLTAIILAPLVIWLILAGSTPLVAAVLALVILLAAREWAMLAGLQTIMQSVFVGLTVVLLALGWIYREMLAEPQILQLVSVYWVLLTLMLLLRRKPIKMLETKSIPALITGLALLPMAWVSIVTLHEFEQNGPQLVLAVLLLIWLADSGAYFSGRAFGKHKLAPMVSPGKTWEGVFGALLGAALFAWLLQQHSVFADQRYILLLLLCVAVTLVSIGGDLYESLIKRQRGVKDSSNLLPGHGGILDRIDSLIAAAPVFLLGVQLLRDSVR